MILVAVLTVGGLIALLAARGYRHRLAVLATTAPKILGEALDSDGEPPVAIRARAVRHGNQQLQAPASGRPCVWWGLRIRPHKRVTSIMLDDIGPPQKAYSPNPFLLSDGTRQVRVEPEKLVTYRHPRSLTVSERLRSWDHTPPVTERVRRSLPELARIVERGTRRLDYTEWLIEEGEEVTITGCLDIDPETGETILRAYTPPGHLNPIFYMTPAVDHTDVDDLRRGYRRDVAVGFFFLIVGGACLLGALFSILTSM